MHFRVSHFWLSAFVLAAAPAWAEDPPKSKPKVTSVSPLAVSRGESTTLKIVGLKLDQANAVRAGAAADAPATQPTTAPAATQPTDLATPVAVIRSKAKVAVPTGADAAKVGTDQLEVELKVPADLAGDELKLVVDTPEGATPAVSLLIKDAKELIDEKEPNNGFRDAQPIQVGKTVRGTIDSAGDVDVFRLEAKKGDVLVAEVTAHRRQSLLDSLLTLYDDHGHVLNQNDDADGPDSLLKFTLPADGTYFLSVTDANNRGGVQFPYLLSLDVTR